MKGCLTICVFFPLGILAFLFMWPAFIIIIPLWCIMMVIPTRSSQAPASAPQKIICPNCGKSYHESFTYCPYCKTKLVQPSYTGNRYERALSAFWDNLSGGGQAVVVMAVLAALCFIAKSVQK